MRFGEGLRHSRVMKSYTSLSASRTDNALQHSAASLSYVTLFPASCAVTLFYAMLFLACLAGVCALVLIGDKLRRGYIDWCEGRDIIRNERSLARCVIPQSSSFGA